MNQKSDTTQPTAWIKWLFPALLLLCLFAALVWLILPSGSSSAIQARIDAIKKAGYPVTAQDLDKLYPPLPDDQNSVVIYQKAFSQYAPVPADATNWPVVSDSAFPFRSQPLPPEVKQGIADFVNQNKETLELLHEAAGIEKGYYDDGLKSGFSNFVSLPFIQIRECAQLLALAVISHAEDRQPAAATQSILDSLGPPKSMERDPRLVSQIIRDDTVGLSCSSLELALNKTSFSEDELGSLATAYHETEPSDGVKQSLIYSRCEGIWYREQLKASPLIPQYGTLRERLEDLYYRLRYYRDGDFVIYLDTMEQYLAAADMPYPNRLEAVKLLSSKTKVNNVSKRVALTFLITDWEKVFLTDAKTRTQTLLAETALAIERYRLANHDQLPATLQALVPSFLSAVPADPFDGKPLRYHKLPKGYLIYSIGEDGVDNGGQEWNADAKTGDLTFTVER